MTKIAFVHVPKTAGLYVFNSLHNNCLDICEKSKEHTRVSEFLEHPHGHTFITMIRDPYQRSVSHYHYVGRNWPKSLNVSIEEWLLNEPIQSYQHYYDKLTPSNFDVIGNVEDMVKTKILFERSLGINLMSKPSNVNPKKSITNIYDNLVNLEDFKKIAWKDYELYYEGLEKFNQLCIEFGV